jgi:hypothetical protein
MSFVYYISLANLMIENISNVMIMMVSETNDAYESGFTAPEQGSPKPNLIDLEETFPFTIYAQWRNKCRSAIS